MEYAHGKRLTPLHHELENEFERRLQQLKMKASVHYGKPPPENETPDQKAKRLAQQKADFVHLEAEARHIETLGFVYARLESYQKTNRATPGESLQDARARQKRLMKEAHHPIDILDSNMRAQGRPKPSPNHTAHHVAPGRGWTENANRARVRMHLYGLGINDGDNGAYMLKAKQFKPHHWFAPHAQAHKEIHTQNYELWVWHKIQKANSEADLRLNLRTIGNMLETGAQPKAVRYPPLQQWVEE